RKSFRRPAKQCWRNANDRRTALLGRHVGPEGPTYNKTKTSPEQDDMSAETYPSMNEASDRDPYNNNSYGTLVDSGYKRVTLPMLDVRDFNERIIRGYEEGYAEKDLPADLSTARSLIPAGTATLRDFSYIAPDIPEYIEENA